MANIKPVDKTPDIMVMKFADSKVPVFKESKNKDYIKYGEDDNYANYLTYLFDKSSKHNAIVSGKADFIFGGGYENGNMIVNRLDESLNDIAKKCVLDIEIYGGFYLEIIWGFNRKISEIYHVDYTTLRKGKNKGFYFKEDWSKYNNDDPEFINEFNHINPVGNQIYFYKQYRPKTRFYPLPGYIGSNNYIEIDIEISKYYLSCIRNGMMPSKMIQFFTGEPTDDKKRDIELRLQKKFSGSENAGKFFMVFNGNANNKAVQIDDLSASDLDKHMDGLNKTTQQEIFTGHKVTSGMIFGVKTEGQLGGNTELKTSYEAFDNSYARPRAEAFDKEIGFILSYSLWPGQYELKAIDPIGIQFDVKDFVNALPKEFVFKSLGIPEDMWNGQNIGSIMNPASALPAPNVPVQTDNDMPPVNAILQNLTSKQRDNVLRTIRQYTKGQITEAAAKVFLRGGYGLTEAEINDLLGILPIAAMKFEQDEVDEITIGLFDACGDAQEDWEVLKSKRVSFNNEVEAEADESIYIEEAFKTYDVTNSESAILEIIKKDAKATPEVIAKATGNTVAYIQSKLDSLTKRGYLESITEVIGSDVVTSRIVPKGIDITIPPKKEDTKTVVKILYSYEGPKDSRNRPFCAKLLSLNRFYSREEIETISERLGYSVFDRRGGFWRHKDGTITPYCRHNWKSNIVVKKVNK